MTFFKLSWVEFPAACGEGFLKAGRSEGKISVILRRLAAEIGNFRSADLFKNSI